MAELTEEHSKLLLSKDWLVKIDGQRSKPYLLKVYTSTVDASCCVLITDTKATWAEADAEGEWRSRRLALVSQAHTLGGITNLSFEVVDSPYSDAAFELECEAFKWRWETYSVSPKLSADLISRHLIMPLISLNHLAFASTDPVSALSEVELASATDKIARTARRSIDTHVKHALSKPRVVTTLTRMTAMFNFISDLSPIKPDLQMLSPMLETRTPVVQAEPKTKASPSSSLHYSLDMDVDSPEERLQPTDIKVDQKAAAAPQAATKVMVDDDSATESSDDDVQLKGKGKAQASHAHDSIRSPPPPTRKSLSPIPSPNEHASDDSPVPPVRRPAKKAKSVVAGSSDSEDEQQRSRNAAGAKRGTRQPIKRGGKWF